MGYTLHCGDCLEVMQTLEANSVDTIVTDPPYGLSFMGKDWDHGVPGAAFWREALRVAKPGAMLLAFGGTRTFHRLTVAIEDAGWEVRDVVSWLYGSGFPKSLDISKAIDKAAGEQGEEIGTKRSGFGKRNGVKDDEGGIFLNSLPEQLKHIAITAPATPAAQQWHGWGTALKPAWEPIIMAMKPLDGTFAENAAKWGVCGLNIDGARIPITDGATMARNNKPGDNGWKNSSGGPNAAALYGEPAGRWPANLLLDEDAAAMLDAQSGERRSAGLYPTTYITQDNNNVYQKGVGNTQGRLYEDTGGASRFFYVAKASRSERNAGLEGMEALASGHRSNFRCRVCGHQLANGTPCRCSEPDFEEVPLQPQANHHPTVKPLALMRYLVRLTSTPTGGVVLDPFMGSGTTGVACMLEGRHFIGIDKEPEYVEIARRRIAAAVLPLIREAAD